MFIFSVCKYYISCILEKLTYLIEYRLNIRSSLNTNINPYNPSILRVMTDIPPITKDMYNDKKNNVGFPNSYNVYDFLNKRNFMA